jgi:hypothetical protein
MLARILERRALAGGVKILILPCLTDQNSKKLNRSEKKLKRKVVDLGSLYNFYKGRMAFFQPIVHKLQAHFVVF